MMISSLSFSQDTLRIKTPPIDTSRVDKKSTIAPEKKEKKKETVLNIIQLSAVALPVIIIETFSPDK